MFLTRYNRIMLQTDAEKNYKTDEKSLLQEFVVTIREYFDISVVQQEGKAVISLANGQRFLLELSEIKQ